MPKPSELNPWKEILKGSSCLTKLPVCMYGHLTNWHSNCVTINQKSQLTLMTFLCDICVRQHDNLNVNVSGIIFNRSVNNNGSTCCITQYALYVH